MKFKKPIMVAGAVGTVGIASVIGGGLANAATTTSSSTTTAASSLVDKIANTFHLNTADVQKVFDQNRTEKQAAEQAKVEADLTQAVTDGKLTADQKAKILAKRTELQAQRDANKDSMKDKTDAERKAAMEAERTALEKWASDNGIAKEYLRYVREGRGPGGPPPADGSTTTN